VSLRKRAKTQDMLWGPLNAERETENGKEKQYFSHVHLIFWLCYLKLSVVIESAKTIIESIVKFLNRNE